MAKLSLFANGIYASVRDAGFSFTSEGLTVSNGKIIIKNKLGENVFEADEQGNLTFTGAINSQDGFLSGWILEDDELIAETGEVGIHSGSRRKYGADPSPVRFWAGNATGSTSAQAEGDSQLTYYNFAVTDAGSLYANNADVSGNIIAYSGRILNTFYVGPNDNTGIIISGDDKGSFIGSMQYASGALGGGWAIRSDGSAEFNNVSVRGKITSAVFEYDHISSVGGSLYVAPTLYTTKTSDVIYPIDEENYTYLFIWELDTSVRLAFGNKQIKVGYKILLDCNININGEIIHLSNIFGSVALGSNGDQDAALGLSLTLDFKLPDTAFVEPGAALVLYGTDTTREGLFLTAMGENSPYLEIYSNNENDMTPIPAARLGNLSGIIDANFSSVNGKLSGYGLYSSNAYLRGQLILPNAGITNQTAVSYEGSPIRIWAGLDEGDTSIDKANFIVTQDGSLIAKRGVFEGIVKAENSEFSGNIRAAGILLDEQDSSQNDTLHDHFYVAYNIAEEGKPFEPSYKNYVLNIDKDGLSIWEGGLQAYSDFANGDNPFGANQSHLLAYKANSTTGEAYPFFYLVDHGTSTELTSRLVVNKLHVINFTPTTNGGGTVFPIISTQLNNGIWFYGEQRTADQTPYEDIEMNIFNRKNAGITLFDNQKLLLKNDFSSGSIHIRSNGGVWINSADGDETTYTNNALFVRGNVQLASNETLQLRINGAVIEEVKNAADGKTIGLNFISSVG